ncbi:hypothetical protein TVNIR_1026 [Thioalkalivibrio nitratireducens DSM 14787]|uniref:Lipoprotein n=1 Tax=Thioalkalivibrio nitratireducens (strain DSM 14787 / UNIQEM 213 / ALEN2) TaxID=1255043 RepID=L0DUP2_THIND|nr:hypothetical protein [Thioalkalivibrio nitratireducens]AGA32710.1 hypothetical protein TVNIR_1026 [Thioalkalivibrio nitratireducens DSM 14787]
MFKTLIAIGLAAGLIGCALVDVKEDPASPYYLVPEGSVIELHQPVAIPPGTTRVWFVRGRVAPGRDWYNTSCNLEINTLDRNRVQTVEAGRFVVRRVQRTSASVAQSQPSVEVAMLGGGIGGDSGYNRTWQGYHLWLASENQPDVRRLTCAGIYGEPRDAKPPSINEMRAALGTVASLRLP